MIKRYQAEGRRRNILASYIRKTLILKLVSCCCYVITYFYSWLTSLTNKMSMFLLFHFSLLNTIEIVSFSGAVWFICVALQKFGTYNIVQFYEYYYNPTTIIEISLNIFWYEIILRNIYHINIVHWNSFLPFIFWHTLLVIHWEYTIDYGLLLSKK